MIAFFTVCYCLGIWLFFVKMKITPNPVNIAVAVVIGVVVIGTIVVFWQFAAPSSSTLVVSKYAVQIVPQVRGPITKIHAEPNVPLRKGQDVLFEIQKDTYQFAVDQLSGSLDAAKRNVDKLEAGVRISQAALTQSQAQLAAVEAEKKTALNTQELNSAAISQLEVDQIVARFDAASAAVAKAKSTEDQAHAALASSRNTVESLEAQLSNAKFQLDQCTVYAPADGFVTNWQVREGTMAVDLPFAPVGTFIDTSRTNLIANFSQQVCRNMRAGDPVEISLATRPGEVFAGTVDAIIQATGEGQFQTTGQLISAADLGSQGQFAVKLALDDEDLARSLAMGTGGTAVIYTDFGKPFHIISKVVVRINAWMYYLNPF